MAWDPLAQAPETVRLMPLRWKITPRFIVTVEFIDWKMAPEPHSIVSFFSTILEMDLYTASAVLSLPYSSPTSWLSRYSWSMPACFRASRVAQ